MEESSSQKTSNRDLQRLSETQYRAIEASHAVTPGKKWS